jgi:flagellar assembly protein FliH
MSEPISKGQMSPYMRWELASFDEPVVSRELEADNRPTIEELAAIRDEARRKGRAEGYADGHAEGRDAGWEQGIAEAASELVPLQRIAGAFGNEIAKIDEQVNQQLLDLALDLAKAMLKSALTVRPELVVPVVAEAVRYLPAVQQPALLYLHPGDALLVREHIGEELDKTGWRVFDDAQIERGGCRVETASNQIDATAQSRWQRIAAALSRDGGWLAE